jgi:hypothetical protein
MYHWNDRFYESNACPKCGGSEMERTIAELEKALAEHKC